jgi:hypothetical protein
MRGIRVALLAVGAAIVVTGCGVAFYDFPTTSQKAHIGPVAVNLDLCVSDVESGDTCEAGPFTSSPDPTRLLLAFMVPKGTSAPASFTGTPNPSDVTNLSGDAVSSVTMTRSSAYATAIQHAITPNKGEEWVGYVSAYFNFDNTGTSDQLLTAAPAFGLPAGKSGGAFAGPFPYQLLLGALYWVQNGSSETTPATTNAFDCGTSATEAENGQSIPTAPATGTAYNEEICVFNFFPATIKRLDPVAVDDAGIVPGKTLSVSPGSTDQIRFTFQYQGASSAGRFKLSASTTVKHGSAHSSQSSIGSTTKTIKVKIHVPAGTKRGTYKVKLTAKLSNGQSRTGTATIKVK